MIADEGLASTWRDAVSLAGQLAEDFRNPSMQHQVVTLLMRGQRTLAYGVNQLRYARGASYFYGSLHAEADLIKRHPEKIRGAKVFLYRFNNAPSSPHADQPLCAKPCPLCSHMLRMAGVGRVVWISDAGQVESVRGHELQLLTGDPTLLTQRFLDTMGHDHHGKFVAANYLAAN